MLCRVIPGGRPESPSSWLVATACREPCALETVEAPLPVVFVWRLLAVPEWTEPQPPPSASQRRHGVAPHDRRRSKQGSACAILFQNGKDCVVWGVGMNK